MVSDYPEIEESDCCHNGCQNCILDHKPEKFLPASSIGKMNILSQYTKFKLVSKSQPDKHPLNILELEFQCNDLEHATSEYCLAVPPGHHVMMRAPVLEMLNGDSKYVLRPYSPYLTNSHELKFKILVNLNPDGAMSRYISGLKIDDEVEFRGPIGTYYHATAPSHIIIISQGVAIAPTMPIIEEILDNEEDLSQISHLSCFRDVDSILFRDRMREYNKYWNYKSRIYLSHQRCEREKCMANNCSDTCDNFTKQLRYKESIFSHRLDIAEINEICQINADMEKIFVVCGGREFQNNIRKSIKSLELRVQDEQIFLL